MVVGIAMVAGKLQDQARPALQVAVVVVAGLALVAIVVAVAPAGLLAGAAASVPASASVFHDFDEWPPSLDHILDIEHPYIDDSGLARTGN